MDRPPADIRPTPEPMGGRGRVVVGVDRSAAAESALRWACAEAHRRDADLLVVHCSTGGFTSEGGGFRWGRAAREGDAPAEGLLGDGGWHDLRHFRDHLVSVVRREEIDPDRVSIELWPLGEGGPGASLAEAAREALLLVVGTRGEAALSALVLGSVSRVCLQVSRVPVVIVSHRPRPDTETVMVGVDGSEQSYAAFEWAVHEAVRRDAAAVMVHCSSAPTVGPVEGEDLSRHESQRLEEDTRLLAARLVDRWQAEHGQMPVRTSSLAVSEAAGPGLVDAARAADLLVLGARHRSATAGLLIGSVAEAVVARCDCPVIVMPHAGYRPGLA